MSFTPHAPVSRWFGARIVLSAIFGKPYIARSAGRAISDFSIEVGFRRSAVAGLRNKLRGRSKVGCGAILLKNSSDMKGA
jgi:hypothetical protein